MKGLVLSDADYVSVVSVSACTFCTVIFISLSLPLSPSLSLSLPLSPSLSLSLPLSPSLSLSSEAFLPALVVSGARLEFSLAVASRTRQGPASCKLLIHRLAGCFHWVDHARADVC